MIFSQITFVVLQNNAQYQILIFGITDTSTVTLELEMRPHSLADFLVKFGKNLDKLG